MQKQVHETQSGNAKDAKGAISQYKSNSLRRLRRLRLLRYFLVVSRLKSI